MERGRKEEMGRKKKGSICLLLLAVLHITMPAIASGNYSLKMPKVMIHLNMKLMQIHWCVGSFKATASTTKKKSKRCVWIHSLLASLSSLQVRTPAPLQPRGNRHSVTSHGQRTSQQQWGILLCSSVASRTALPTLPSPFMVVTATTAYSAHPGTWKTFPR